ncbi:hatching enzyme 1.2-like [Myxocyprinus asiaticus]|uniref:hatching enzyme 1.2-like n=1 Tax=Myxocyprinus asiaticus TaxID=70543 RepID=UPI002222DEE6|nr:hatching enzyme 1.2-like [Myxocyprinus asiaticus]
MYLLVVVISLLLSFHPAQSRYVEDIFKKISAETDNSIERDDKPVSAILEVNKHAGQGLDGAKIIFGDIAVATGFKNADPCTARGCKWKRSKNGKVYVPYIISNQYSPQEIGVIEDGLKSFEQLTCIRFKPHRGQRNFIHIKSDSGCFSYLGRQGGEQTVSLDRAGCVHFSIVQHELLHALGFHHEQNRSDRDGHVQIIYENIIAGLEYNFDIKQTNNLGTPYDYNSVMQYSRYAFTKNNQPTIIPIPDQNVVIGEARSMSPNDIMRVNRLYCS